MGLMAKASIVLFSNPHAEAWGKTDWSLSPLIVSNHSIILSEFHRFLFAVSYFYRLVGR